MYDGPGRVGDHVRVVYRKYDGSLHWHYSARHLGVDEYGRWVGYPAGTVARRGDEPPVVWDHASAMLFPRDTWWTAMVIAAPHDAQIYCDIATVPEWCGPGLVTMVDLDLDVVRLREGRTYIDDEDEFAEHQVRFGYPPDVTAAARHTAERLLPQVRDGIEPFGDVGLAWLALVTEIN